MKKKNSNNQPNNTIVSDQTINDNNNVETIPSDNLSDDNDLTNDTLNDDPILAEADLLINNTDSADEISSANDNIIEEAGPDLPAPISHNPPTGIQVPIIKPKFYYDYKRKKFVSIL